MFSLKRHALLASICGLAALAGCETIEEEVTEAVGPEFIAILAPVGAGTGSGKAEISLDDTANRLCTDLELSGAGTVSAAHVMGPGGAVLVDVDAPDDNDSDDCDDVSDAIIDGIRANPGAYSVHVQASGGELSGPLARGG